MSDTRLEHDLVHSTTYGDLPKTRYLCLRCGAESVGATPTSSCPGSAKTEAQVESGRLGEHVTLDIAGESWTFPLTPYAEIRILHWAPGYEGAFIEKPAAPAMICAYEAREALRARWSWLARAGLGKLLDLCAPELARPGGTLVCGCVIEGIAVDGQGVVVTGNVVGATLIGAASAPFRAPFFHVDAVGDGVVDDTEAVQAALNRYRRHNHGPIRPSCPERVADGVRRGECLNDDGSDR